MSKQLDSESIIDTLAQLFNSVFEGDINVENLSADSRLIEDLGMNSIGLLYMAMTVEEEFGIKFENSDFEILRSVGDVVSLIQNRIG